ncbi:MAG: magnesium transporter [Myxococcaceae bacterium]
MLGTLLKPEFEELLQARDYDALRGAFSEMSPPDIAEVIEDLPPQDSGVLFRVLPRDVATTVFEYLPLDQQTEVVEALGTEQLVGVLNEMAPDDRTRLFEELPAEVTKRALATLKPDQLSQARRLLGYPEGKAGRYMTPRYLALRPTATAEQALHYVREHGQGIETLDVIYVTDEQGVLLDDVKLVALVKAQPNTKLSELNDGQLVSLRATEDRSDVVAMFEKYDLVALPVTDSKGVLLGIITVDDVLDVAEEKATREMQGLGGVEALDAPYFDVGFVSMCKKRGGWLSVLFLGEMLTATAMTAFEDELAKAVVLSLFLPLIISSGGNSGSQATSILIRSLALREVRLRDWWRVASRELASGVTLGALLGSIGFLRILVWAKVFHQYGQHYLLVASVVALALVGVVLYGNLVGSMLPFILRRMGFDPAKASAPFVATLVDVSGLIIYFNIAKLIFRGTLL